VHGLQKCHYIVQLKLITTSEKVRFQMFSKSGKV